MDRTILPGIPAGEDVGAVVGVEGPDSKGRNNTTVKIRVNRDSTRKAGSRDKAVLEGRTAATGADPEVGPEDPAARNSVGRGR